MFTALVGNLLYYGFNLQLAGRETYFQAQPDNRLKQIAKRNFKFIIYHSSFAMQIPVAHHTLVTYLSVTIRLVLVTILSIRKMALLQQLRATLVVFVFKFN